MHPASNAGAHGKCRHNSPVLVFSLLSGAAEGGELSQQTTIAGVFFRVVVRYKTRRGGWMVPPLVELVDGSRRHRIY